MEIVRPSIGRFPMTEHQRAAIKSLKANVSAMLEERRTLERTRAGATSPSAYWTEVCSFFDYMLGLPEESFARLRLHTYHLTGDHYQTYFFEHDKDAMLASWRRLTRHLPRPYILSEPDGGMGYLLDDGTIISRDLLRFQRVVTTLYEQRVLPLAGTASGGARRILEIGAGYAGLAHHLARLVPQATYTIVDLPETLLFAGAYLTLVNPDKRISVYAPGGNAGTAPPVDASDFLLLPDYRLQDLRDLRYDLVINVASLQEMRIDQVQAYLDLIADTCAGVFYSFNQDVQRMNRELGNLSDMLRDRFEVTEIPLHHRGGRRGGFARALARVVRTVAGGLLGRPRRRAPYRQYLCRPRG